MPQVRPVTASTMNYAGPIMGSVCILSWIWYKLHWVRLSGERQRHKLLVELIYLFLSQHHNYVGPGSVSEVSGTKSETESFGRIDKEKFNRGLPETNVLDVES